MNTEILHYAGVYAAGIGTAMLYILAMRYKVKRGVIKFIQTEWAKYVTLPPVARKRTYEHLVQCFGQERVNQSLPELKKTGV